MDLTNVNLFNRLPTPKQRFYACAPIKTKLNEPIT